MTWDSRLSRAQVLEKVPRVSWVWGETPRPGAWAPERLHVFCRNLAFGLLASLSEETTSSLAGLGGQAGTQGLSPAGSSLEPSARKKRSLSSFSFLHSPSPWGPAGRGRELVKGHLRLLFNETIHVQDRITCIKCTRLLIHLVIKQGITPGLMESEMTACFHPLHRWGN